MFVKLNESVNENVSCGDESKIPVKGKDTYLIQLNIGATNLFPMLLHL